MNSVSRFISIEKVNFGEASVRNGWCFLATIKPPDILGVRKSFSGVIMKKPPSIINLWSAKLQIYIRGGIVMSNYTDDLHSLSHTKWNCKYHVVFAPKYRRKAFYDGRRVEIGKILRDLCNWKGVNILEAEVCVDHVHMLIEVPPKMSVSGFMGFLKGKSSQMIYEKWANARFKYNVTIKITNMGADKLTKTGAII